MLIASEPEDPTITETVDTLTLIDLSRDYMAYGWQNVATVKLVNG